MISISEICTGKFDLSPVSVSSCGSVSQETPENPLCEVNGSFETVV